MNIFDIKTADWVHLDDGRDFISVPIPEGTTHVRTEVLDPDGNQTLTAIRPECREFFLLSPSAMKRIVEDPNSVMWVDTPPTTE